MIGKFQTSARPLAALLILALLPGTASAQSSREEREARIREQGAEIQKEVEEIRGLTYLHDVEKGLMSRSELSRFFADALDEVTDEAVEKDTLSSVKLGLIDEGVDLKAAYHAMYAGAVAGFYDPEEKHFFVIESDSGKKDPMQRMNELMLRFSGAKRSQKEAVMAHELHHALQDQRFDLLVVQKAIRDNSDENMAIKALVEGEAKSVEFDFTFGGWEKASTNMMVQQQVNPQPYQIAGQAGAQFGGKVPDFLLETLTFSYFPGAKFVQTLRKENGGGWDLLTKAWKNPPRSTEQILHPKEKYLGENRDDPRVVALRGIAGALGEGWEQISDDTMGEYVTGFILRRYGVSSAKWKKASQGWGGDRAYIYRNTADKSAQPVLVWFTLWDTNKDAREFHDAYISVLDKKYPKARGVKRPKERFLLSDGSSRYACWLLKKACVIAESVTEKQLRNLGGVFANARVEDYSAPTVDGVYEDGDTGVNWYENRMIDVKLPLDRDSWKLVSKRGITSGAIVLSRRGSSARFMAEKVFMKDAPKVTMNKAFGEMALRKIGRRVSSITGQRVRETMIDGHSAVVLRFNAVARGKERAFLQAWVKIGKRFYILTGVSGPEDASAMRKDASHFIKEAKIG